MASKFAHDSHEVRRGLLPLARVWWQLSWDSCCKEVLARYGTERRSCFDPSSVEGAISIGMDGLHRLLFEELEKDVALKDVESKRLRLWRSLEAYEGSKNRPVDYEKMGFFYPQCEKRQRPVKFNRQACSYMWRRAIHAWRDGWLLHPVSNEPAQRAPTERFCVDTNKVNPNPGHEIPIFDQGWYKCVVLDSGMVPRRSVRQLE